MAGRGSRLRLAAALAAILAILVPAAPAHAFSLPGAVSMALGLVDDLSFEESPAPVESTWLSRARAIGSAYVRLTAYWSQIAPVSRPRRFHPGNPADRHYRWAALDQAVRVAAAHGEHVTLMALSAPSWAEPRGIPAGVRAGTWFPDAREFGAFGHALSIRYSGHFRDPLDRRRMLPRVRYFQAWNEPNLPFYLMPQWGRSGHGAWQPVSPGIYRALLNAFYAGVKSAQPGSVVLSAGTAPYGDPPASGEGRMRPVTFLKDLFCLTARMRPYRCGDPPHLDGLDHHPYAIGPTVKARNAGDISVPDLDKIWAIVHVAQRYGHVLPDGPKSLWVTEIDWASAGRGSSPTLQAEDLAAALYEFWRQRVSHVFWFELTDQPKTNSFATGGLYYSNGAPKPAVAAYRFPFAAVLLPHRHHYATAVWGRAPVRGVVSIQRLVGTRWRQIARLRTTAGGIFYTVRSLHVGVALRAVIGREASPVFVTSFSP